MPGLDSEAMENLFPDGTPPLCITGPATVGDMVYVFSNNKVLHAKVEKVSIEVDDSGTHILYKVAGVSRSVTADKVGVDRAAFGLALVNALIDEPKIESE